MQIRSLEKDLGIKLFNRTKNHRLKLTREGQLFYDMAIPYLQGIEGLFENFLCKINEEKENKINIAAHHAILSHILPKYIKKFLDKYPNTKFVLKNITREEAYKEILIGEIDFAIYPIEIKNLNIPPEFDILRAFNYDLSLIMYKNHYLVKKASNKITQEDMFDNNLIHMDKKMMTADSWINILFNKQNNSNIEMVNGTWEITKGLVKENIGISAMARFYVENDKEIISKKMSSSFSDLIYYVFLKKNVIISKKSKLFLDLLKKNFDYDDSL